MIGHIFFLLQAEEKKKASIFSWGISYVVINGGSILLSRDSYFGNLVSFIRLFTKEVRKRPFAPFSLPFEENKEDRGKRDDKN